MVEPNDAGGWAVTGPVETRDLMDIFDPEQAEAKRQRVRAYLDENKFDLTSGGTAADKVAAKTQLPLQVVESELKSYAKENPGLAAKRIEGKLMLYREGSAISADPGGSNMPFWEKHQRDLQARGIFRKEDRPPVRRARASNGRSASGATTRSPRSKNANRN